MKRLLLLALLPLSFAADAATVAMAVNQVGGVMLLTDEPCNETSAVAVTYDNGKPSTGCWLLWRGSVYIKWDELDSVIRYDATDFKPATDL